jgi:hypothetical protein
MVINQAKLKGRRFQNADELFLAVQEAWDTIPEIEIDKLVGTFRARCQVCVELGGARLNGHWRRVHEIHHVNDPSSVPRRPTFIEE